DATEETDAPLVTDPPLVADPEHETEPEGRMRLSLWPVDLRLSSPGNVRAQTWSRLGVEAAFLVEIPIDHGPDECELRQPKHVGAGVALHGFCCELGKRCSIRTESDGDPSAQGVSDRELCDGRRCGAGAVERLRKKRELAIGLDGH